MSCNLNNIRVQGMQVSGERPSHRADDVSRGPGCGLGMQGEAKPVTFKIFALRTLGLVCDGNYCRLELESNLTWFISSGSSPGSRTTEHPPFLHSLSSVY